MEQENEPLISTSTPEESTLHSVENLENNINSNQNIDSVTILPKENIDEPKKVEPLVDQNSAPPDFYSTSKISTELPPETIRSVGKTEISESKEKIEQDIKNEVSPHPVSESKQDIEQDTKPERSFSTIEPPTTQPVSESKQDTTDSKKENDLPSYDQLQCNKAIDLFYGRKQKQNMEEAIKIWAAAKHHPESLAYLYLCNFHGFGIPKDKVSAQKYLRSSAKRGNNYCLGECYFYGVAADKNVERAIENYKKSADSGFPPALFDLGTLYEKGVVVPKDFTIAVDYLQRAADFGYAPAQNSLGALYAKGIGLVKDQQIALNYFKMAADQNHPIALYNLGIFYETGKVVTKDLPTAVNYYTMSADRGHPLAQYNLAICYLHGNGIGKDPVNAVKYFKMSADKGTTQASLNLAQCYEKGIGIEKNIGMAIQYYEKAATGGDETAKKKVEKLAKKK